MNMVVVIILAFCEPGGYHCKMYPTPVASWNECVESTAKAKSQFNMGEGGAVTLYCSYMDKDTLSNY